MDKKLVLRLGIVILLIGIITITLGGKGCPWTKQKEDKNISTDSSGTPAISYTTEAIGTIGQSGGILEVTNSNSSLYRAKIEIPQEVVTDNTSFEIRHITGGLPPLPAGLTPIGEPIQIASSLSSFSHPIRVAIPYPDANNDGLVDGMTDSIFNLGLAIYNQSTGQWELSAPSVLHGVVDFINKTSWTISTNPFIGQFAIYKLEEGTSFQPRVYYYKIENIPTNKEGSFGTTEVKTEIAAAIQRWDDVLPNISFRNIETSPSSPVTVDIEWRTMGIRNLLAGGDLLGYASVGWTPSLVYNGSISLNDSYTWGINVFTGSEIDIQQLVLHEFGHILGMWGHPTPTQPPIMGASYIGRIPYGLYYQDLAALARKYTVSLPEPLSILTTSLPTFNQNELSRYWLNAKGGMPPYNWSVSPALPRGEFMLIKDGLLSKITPTASSGSQTYTFTVTDNNSTASVNLILTVLSNDTSAPVFSGLASATTESSSSIRLTWLPAADDNTPADKITYQIYRSKTTGGINYSSPPLLTVRGITSTLISGLESNTTYYFVVRAKDQAGNTENNSIQQSATTTPPETVSVPNQPTGITAGTTGTSYSY
ncbi:MAG: matrixin family metalloprotease, partial [Planctomycetota bacterium]|nr:matrixin family metalloprotease [Planctomycetota bacterium]